MSVVLDVNGARLNTLSETEINAKIAEVTRLYQALVHQRLDLEKIPEARIDWNPTGGHDHRNDHAGKTLGHNLDNSIHSVDGIAKAGNLLRRGSSGRFELLTPGTTGDVLQMVGGLPTWTNSALGKKMFSPATYGNGTHIFIGEHPSWKCSVLTGQTAYTELFIPNDFLTLQECVVILVAESTDFKYGLNADYGAVGEAYNAHTGSVGSTNVISIANRIYELNAATMLGSLAANDHVGIRITETGVALTTGGFWVLGVRLRYL